MAFSSSASSVHKSYKYDVFLSFYGEDTRRTFVDHLYAALEKASIHIFKDDKRPAKGKMINDELLQSIEDSRFYIIVFSKNYASSSWCLNELLKIMECQEKNEQLQIAYPVFYGVEPTEFRNQSGSVGKALSAHKNVSKVWIWREALTKAANLSGWDLREIADGHKVVRSIVEDISCKLYSSDYVANGDYIVGIGQRMHHIDLSLKIGLDDVRMIGIKGMGGSGKTTLARAIFDKLSSQFEARTFVADVREKASLSGLNSMQNQVLADISKDKHITVSNVHGKEMMKRILRRTKVLVVLDDVDNNEQFEALAGDSSWFKPGSRIIITTRDEQVLLSHRVSFIHTVDLLSDREATVLFSRYAFGKNIPLRGYEKESLEVVRYAAGLPLTVKVLGSFLHGRPKDEWIDALAKLKIVPLRETLENLEVSYESLDNDHKEIFLDIACLLKNWRTEDAIRMLDGCGYNARIGLRVLQRKSLITIEEVHETKYEYDSLRYDIQHYERICMHDHIEEMGKNIVRRFHPDEPNRHSRLWIKDEIKYILANDLGTIETRCIRMELTPDIDMTGLQNMKRLQCLIVNYDIVSSDDADYVMDGQKVVEYLPNSLRYVYWRRYHHRYLSKISGADNIATLEIHNSKIERLWDGGVDMKNLNFLVLNECENLKSLPRSFCSLQRLKVLMLDYCGIEELPGDFGQLEYLAELSLKFCIRLRLLPDSICKLKHLKILALVHCFSLEKLPKHLGKLESLEVLDISWCKSVVTIPSSICNLKRLKKLDLKHCKELEKLPEKVGDLVSLQELNIEKTSISQLPQSISLIKGLKLRTSDLWKLGKKGDVIEYNVPSDESLCVDASSDTDDELVLIDVHNVKIHRVNRYFPKALAISSWIHSFLPKTFQLGNLVALKMASSRIVWLWEGGERKVLNSLRFLDLNHSKLRTFDLRVASNLKELHLGGCHDLVELCLPVEILKLEFLMLNNSKLRTLDLALATNLEQLHLGGCHDLVEFHLPLEVLHLRFLILTGSKLRTLDLGRALNLELLELKECHDLVELDMPKESLNLRSLKVSNLKLKTFDLGLIPNLEKLELEECHNLAEVHMPPNLKRLNLQDSYHLIELHIPIGCLKWLVFLNLSGCSKINSFSFIKELKSLKFLFLARLYLKEFPDIRSEQGDSSLLELHFRYNDIEELPSSIANLHKLVYLDLHSCRKLKCLPKGICGLQHLRNLQLYGCSVEKLPEDIDRLECLEKLDLSFTPINHLPDSVCMLKHLKTLNLSFCWNLEKLPEHIGGLECLQKLILTECTQVRDIPDSICKLKCLKHLCFLDCILLQNLPKELGFLESLKVLNLEGTRIRYLPQSISSLKNLRIYGPKGIRLRGSSHRESNIDHV